MLYILLNNKNELAKPICLNILMAESFMQFTVTFPCALI